MKPRYVVEQVGPGTTMIFDQKGVAMYLLEGRDKALLIDTGYGDPQLPGLVSELTSKPLKVVNTHLHPDHMGGNYLFETVYAPAADIPAAGEDTLFEQMLDRIQQGMEGKHSLKNNMLRKMIRKFQFIPAGQPPLPLPETPIQLGGRDVLVYPCPGHTPGSVMFLDPLTKTVFAGDCLGIWLFTNPAQKLDNYIAEMQKAARLEGYEKVWMSHINKVREFRYIEDFAAFLEGTKTRKTKKIMLPGYSSPLLMYDKMDRKKGYFSAWYFADQREP